MENTKKTRAIIFENFNIDDIQQDDMDSLGYALVSLLEEVKNDERVNKNTIINNYGNFAVKAEISLGQINNYNENSIIIKIKTYYEEEKQ